ncbi:diaminopimelate epimerase [Peribacillus cavernae]|uniref:Diaminopimelate epimerase n=1 Tax=Peribacillus cavernae TaxID=1674310 RepID=A0A3S0VQD8_9BACI|nr:diaminopimelate epimerase [Peribacillus cavernae]MDQ0217885.1 diaminopimelate epimerase [Peribacillus cavernae]RUQ32548.1 diaminopimelate epimerase [Peribacillus cavernae]
MNVELLKCHGSGNDFLIIDELTKDISFTEEDRKNLALALCNRNNTLGADGILFVMKSETCDARMRVFNADGSEASMCGNGLRCVARFVDEMLGRDNLVIETMKANLAVGKTEDIYQGIPTYMVEISPVSFHVKDLPLEMENETLLNGRLPGLSNSLSFTALAVPNPHLISIVTEEVLASDVQETLAKEVNGPNHLFPDGVNVSFVKPIEKGHIFVRTFERGVGFTNACGTAMSASSIVTCLNGLNEPEKEISVYNDGGQVKCIVRHDQEKEQYKIDLIGNGTYEYKAAIDIDLGDEQNFKVTNQEKFENEISVYSAFQKEVQNYLRDK